MSIIKRVFVIMLIIPCVVLFTACDNSIKDWKEYSIIAHAAGSIHGHTYTNSREAFIEHYNNGTRIFEIDFLLSDDEKLIALNDRNSLANMVDFWSADASLTKDEFMQMRLYNAYTTLDFEAIVDLLIKYPDAYVITDTKYSDEVNVKKQFTIIRDTCLEKNSKVLNRIIPQIYNQMMFEYIELIHPFKEYIYTLHASPDTQQQVIDFVLEAEKVVAVTYWQEMHLPYVTALSPHGILVYTETVNNISSMKEALQQGVKGFYSDYVYEDYFTQNDIT